MYHNCTPHLSLLTPTQQTESINHNLPSVASHRTKRKADFPSLVCHPVVRISSFFGTRACTPWCHCCHLPSSSTSSSSPTMYHFGFSSLVLGAPFSGFRLSFSSCNLQIIPTHGVIHKDRILVSSLSLSTSRRTTY